MRKRYKIKIGWGRYPYSFKIEVLTLRRWFIFSWSESVNIRHGSRDDIQKYKREWKKEYDVLEKDIIDNTH